MQKENTKLYTFQFFMLCLSNLLFAASFSMILPELPAYLSTLGGEDFKGLIIGLFTVSAAVSRPFSGKLTDTIGRIPVMIMGTLVCVFCSLLYPFMTSVFGFLLLRFFHGFSTGFKPTAGTAYIADITPEHRRGEGIGIASISGNIGLSAGPILGSFLALYYSINTMFYVSSGIAILSVLVILNLKETLKTKQPFDKKILRLKKEEIISPTAISPAVVTALIYLPYGVILTIIPDQCDFLGIENKGNAFAAFTACSILSRLVAGKVSDKLGRIPVIYLSSILVATSVILTGFATSAMMLLVGVGFLGFSLGIGAPAVFAWTIDRCADHERGQALATIYIALEVGIGVGAVMSAFIYNNNSDNFWLAFLWTGCMVALIVPYLMWRR